MYTATHSFCFSLLRRALLLGLLGMLLMPAAQAQRQPYQGMNFQGAGRDASGQVLANEDLWIQLAFVSGQGSDQQVHYRETHRVTTDDLGLFQLVIGRGDAIIGRMQDIPWAQGGIWLETSITQPGKEGFQLLSRSELQTVPYALYAREAGDLNPDKDNALRANSSIYWTIGGNENTRPPYHFLGNRDANDLTVQSNGQPRLNLSSSGQTQVLGGAGASNSSDENFEDYPLTVSGSEQGIYIKTVGEGSAANNYLTFADGNNNAEGGTILGRVEGQTLDELKVSPPFVRENAIFALTLAQLIADATSTGIEAAGLYAAGTGAAASLIFAFAAPGFYAAAAAATAQAVTIGIETAALIVEIEGFNSTAIENVGVFYTSGGADYAEFLPRKPSLRDLRYGEIVGVRGGQVDLNTEAADHVLVVSHRPVVLGNASTPEQEAQMEKISFLGQVPVRVFGPVQVGDYILPSGNNDGLGIAVRPEALPIGDFDQIVGVAWESAPDHPLNIDLPQKWPPSKIK